MEATLQQQIAFEKANKILGILRKAVKEKMEGIAMAYGLYETAKGMVHRSRMASE